MVRVEVAGEPNGTEVRHAGFFEVAAGAAALEVAPEIEFEKSDGIVAASTCGISTPDGEAEFGKIKRINKGVECSKRALERDVVVDCCGQKHGLFAVTPLDVLGHEQNLGK